MSEASGALWGGRFREEIAEIAHRFSSSISVDGKLWREDIRGSQAHARMLGTVGVITHEEAQAIIQGLSQVAQEIETGAFRFDPSMEDVHLAIEGRLTAIIGSVGGKLHTGRSRNDQVALDERLYMREAIDGLLRSVRRLMTVLVGIADEHHGTIMPGYTHMQRAQPVLLAHHLLAYVTMFSRDAERLQDARTRVDRSPLGSAAFAGTSYPMDRAMTAAELGFASVLPNSIDAVSDRDHLIELISACAITMMHLSRMAEELVLWSTQEFGFLTMSDRVTTGSSIMPQKKNPDMAELIRGKVGRVYGALVNLLTTMKALPLAYDRDMQEDKQPLFDAVGTTRDSLDMMAFMLGETTFHAEVMERSVHGDLLTATEIADYLARKGMPFREAHHITGLLVAYAVAHGLTPQTIPLEVYRGHSTLFEQDLFAVLDPRASVAAKATFGSTNPTMVRAEIDRWKALLS